MGCLMTMVAYNLNFGVKAYIGEETRWIINEYFKGFEKETYPTADKDLCGFKEFYKTWEYYLDNKIADFYEEKSGIRIPIKKPERNTASSQYMSNRLTIPP